MKKWWFLSLLMLGSEAFAHGSLEIIECHNSDNSVVLHGEAVNKENVFNFKIQRKGESVWEKSGAKLELSDTFENKQLIENIKFGDEKSGSAHLKIFEIAAREIRNGTGQLNFSKAGVQGEFTCYAVY